MGRWPTRINESPLAIPTYGHAKACPYNGRRFLRSGGGVIELRQRRQETHLLPRDG